MLSKYSPSNNLGAFWGSPAFPLVQQSIICIVGCCFFKRISLKGFKTSSVTAQVLTSCNLGVKEVTTSTKPVFNLNAEVLGEEIILGQLEFITQGLYLCTQEAQNNSYTKFPVCLYSENVFSHRDDWKVKRNKLQYFREVLGDVSLHVAFPSSLSFW